MGKSNGNTYVARVSEEQCKQHRKHSISRTYMKMGWGRRSEARIFWGNSH